MPPTTTTTTTTTTTRARRSSDPFASSDDYFECEVEGPVYRAGEAIPCQNTGEAHSLTLAQLHEVAEQMRAGGPLLWEHRTTIGHAGKVTRAWVEGDVLHAAARLFAPVTWAPASSLRKRIRAGVTRCFSLGWDVLGGVTKFVELSVCDQGFFDIARMTSVRASASAAESAAAGAAAPERVAWRTTQPSEARFFQVRASGDLRPPTWGRLGRTVMALPPPQHAISGDHPAATNNRACAGTSSSSHLLRASAASMQAINELAPEAAAAKHEEKAGGGGLQGEASPDAGDVTEEDAVRVLRAAATSGKGASPHLMKIEERLKRLQQLEEEERLREAAAAKQKVEDARMRAAAIKTGDIPFEAERFIDREYAASAPECVQLRASGDVEGLRAHLAAAKQAYVENLTAAFNGSDDVQPLLPLMQSMATELRQLRAARAKEEEAETVNRRVESLVSRGEYRAQDAAGGAGSGTAVSGKRKRSDDEAADAGASMRAAKVPRGADAAMPSHPLIANLRASFLTMGRVGVNAPIPDHVKSLANWTKPQAV